MLKNLLIFPIRIYRLVISPLIPKSCRFYPSCSEYAVQSIQYHGALKGLYFAIIRIIKCNQLHPGGYDPVMKEK